jgi:serine/threonine-protein kinase
VFRKSASFVGTPAFISPEQAQNPDQADFRSDIYSLGVTLYYLTTGRMPFVHKDAVMLVKMHISDPPPPIDQPGYPKALARIILKMMEKNPANRYGDYDTLITELKALSFPPPGPGSGGEAGSSSSLFAGLRNLFKR